MVGEDDRVGAERRLPDMLLIARFARAIVLRATQHRLRHPIGLDIHRRQGGGIGDIVVDNTSVRVHVVRVVFQEWCELTIERRTVQGRHLLTDPDRLGVEEGLYAPIERPIIEGVEAQPLRRCLIHVEAVLLAADNLGRVITSDGCDGRRAAIGTRREGDCAESRGVVKGPDAEDQLRCRRRILAPATGNLRRVGATVRCPEDSLVGVQRDFEQEVVDVCRRPCAEFGVFGEVV